MYYQKIEIDAADASVPEWSKGLALRSNIGNDARVQTSPLASFAFCLQLSPSESVDTLISNRQGWAAHGLCEKAEG